MLGSFLQWPCCFLLQSREVFWQMVKFQCQLVLLLEGIKGAGSGTHSVLQGTAGIWWLRSPGSSSGVTLTHLGQVISSSRMVPSSSSAPLLPLGPVSCSECGAFDNHRMNELSWKGPWRSSCFNPQETWSLVWAKKSQGGQEEVEMCPQTESGCKSEFYWCLLQPCCMDHRLCSYVKMESSPNSPHENDCCALFKTRTPSRQEHSWANDKRNRALPGWIFMEMLSE